MKRRKVGSMFDARPVEGDETIMSTLVETMHDADFVVIDGVVFSTEYLRVPDEDTDEDDIVLEAKSGATEIELSRYEIDDAEELGHGIYRLKSGSLIRFLTAMTLH